MLVRPLAFFQRFAILLAMKNFILILSLLVFPAVLHGQVGGPGLKIVKIVPGGLYDKLGLKTGDVIQKVNGQEPANDLFTQMKKGDKIRLTILRDGKTQILHYRLM